MIPFKAKPPVPDPPHRVLRGTRELWRRYWESELVRAVETDTDIAAVTRLFTLYDERERAYRGYKRERLVVGSQGQMVLNPMARAMSMFDAEIRQLEDRLGLTPKSRLQLGIVFASAEKSLRELNANLEIDEEDPR